MSESALKKVQFVMEQSTVNVARTKSKVFLLLCNRFFHCFIIMFHYFIRYCLGKL